MTWRGCSSCGSATCRVDYWRDVVSRGSRNAAGAQVARDDKDARLALGSAEFLCKYVAIKPPADPVRRMAAVVVPLALAGMTSWIIDAGSVRPLGTRRRTSGREAQRAKIRERIAVTGKTSTRVSR